MQDDLGQQALALVKSSGNVTGQAQQPVGKLLLTGDFDTVRGPPVSNFARLNADGSFDSGFAGPPDLLISGSEGGSP